MHAMHGTSEPAREINRLDGILDELRNHMSHGGSADDPRVTEMYLSYYRLRRGDWRVNTTAVRRWAERNR